MTLDCGITTAVKGHFFFYAECRPRIARPNGVPAFFFRYSEGDSPNFDSFNPNTGKASVKISECVVKNVYGAYLYTLTDHEWGTYSATTERLAHVILYRKTTVMLLESETIAYSESSDFGNAWMVWGKFQVKAPTACRSKELGAHKSSWISPIASLNDRLR